MDITRLRTLRELARCRTMAAAAESLHLTPSAVSQQVSQLEREVDMALIEALAETINALMFEGEETAAA